MDLQVLGATYQHYKRGTRYQVIAIGRHSETGEPLIVYKALYADSQFALGQVWCRPAAMFLEEITAGIRRFMLET